MQLLATATREKSGLAATQRAGRRIILCVEEALLRIVNFRGLPLPLFPSSASLRLCVKSVFCFHDPPDIPWG